MTKGKLGREGGWKTTDRVSATEREQNGQKNETEKHGVCACVCVCMCVERRGRYNKARRGPASSVRSYELSRIVESGAKVSRFRR